MADLDEIEHHPWVGPQYEIGINGQHIAIAGYSHHRTEDEHDYSPIVR